MGGCIRVFITLSICLFPQFGFASSDTLTSYQDAENNVKQYRALRRACSITQGEQRRACFAQLNESTEDYKRAKKILSMQNPETDGPLLGRTE